MNPFPIMRAILLLEGAKIRFDRKLAQFMVQLAAFPGRRKLSCKTPLRILIDNSVLRHGLTHTNDWISTGTKLWGGKIPVETGYRARVPREYPPDHAEIYEKEIPFFAPLAHLAKLNRIHFFSSRQLAMERMRHGSYDRYQFGLNIWSKIEIRPLPDIPGTRFFESSIDHEWFSAESQTDRLILGADIKFLSLSHYVAKKNLLDFYHLWTAKHSNCSIFLTTDKKLKRIVENFPSEVKAILDPVRVMHPSELGKELELRPVSHRYLTPLDSDWFYVIR